MLTVVDDCLEEQMKAPISDEECEKFAKGYVETGTRDGGLFRVTDIPPPDGLGAKWPFRMLEERDASHLQGLAVASIESLVGTVVDRSYRPLGNRNEQTAHFHIVTVFASSGVHHRLIAVKRRDERGSGETESLAGEAFDEYLAAMESDGVDVVGTPLICLDPELSDPADRRRLIAKDISYVIQIEAGQNLSHVAWRPEHDVDVLEPLTAADIADVFRRNDDRDRGGDGEKPVIARIMDLRDNRTGATGGFEEYMFQVPVENDVSLHFLSRAALSPSAEPGERVRAATALVHGALEVVRESPARALRAHEFHHPDDGRYYNALRIVDHASTFDTGTEKTG